MGKKEREKTFVKLRAQVSSRAAAPVRYPPFFFIPLYLLRKGGRKKALRPSRATTIVSSSQNSELANRDQLLSLRSGSSFLAFFLFWNRFFWWNFEVFGGFFPWGVSEEEGFQLFCVLWDLRHLALVSLLVVSIFAVEIIAGRNRVWNQIFLFLFFCFFWSCFV
jgi:hypothetical protein